MLRPPYTTRGQRAAAHGMGIVAQKINADFTLALGDNFYYSGIHGSYPHLFISVDTLNIYI